MEVLDLNKVPVKAAHTAYQVIEGEAIILDIPGKTLRGLNPVATRIWQLMDGKRTVGEITKTIVEEFEGDEQEMIQDVKAFMDELLDKKLITL